MKFYTSMRTIGMAFFFSFFLFFGGSYSSVQAASPANCGALFPSVSHEISGNTFYIGDTIPTTFSFQVTGDANTEDGGNVDVVFVMDRSGSMAWPDASGKIKIDAAKSVLREAVDMVAKDKNGGSRASLVTFSSDTTLDYGLSENFQAVKNSIDRITAVGATSIGGGLLTAGTHMKSNGNPDSNKFIILASDGAHNTNPPISAGINAVPSDVTVYTIGITDSGTEFNKENLVKIATTAGTGKGFYSQGNADDLKTIFENIFKEIRKPFLMEDISVSFPAEEIYATAVSATPRWNSKIGSLLTWNNSSPDMKSGDSRTFTINYTAIGEIGAPGTVLSGPSIKLNYTLFGNSCTKDIPFTKQDKVIIEKKSLVLRSGSDCNGSFFPESKILAIKDSAVMTVCDSSTGLPAEGVAWTNSKPSCLSMSAGTSSTRIITSVQDKCSGTIRVTKTNYNPDSTKLLFLKYPPKSGNVNDDEIWKEIQP